MAHLLGPQAPDFDQSTVSEEATRADHGQPAPGATRVARSLPVAELLAAQAEQVAEQARQITGREAHQGGDYQRSIEPASGIEQGGAVGRVNASDFKAGWVEFGTKRQPAKAILRRAAEAEGYRVSSRGRR